jgi:CheY-like chemotaxis protein
MHIPTVLLVEDDQVIQQLYASECERLGLAYVQTFDGLAGLDVLQRGDQIDAVIIDLMIPGIPGNALLEIVTKQFPQVLTIVVSAIAEVSNPLEKIARGQVATIAKGETKIKDIMQRIADVLRGVTTPSPEPEAATLAV